MKAIPTVILIVGIIGGYAFAQNPDVQTTHPTGVIGPDTEIRTFPPYGPFDLFVGERLEPDINSDTRVFILDQRIYYGFSGPHIWYRFTVPNSDYTGWANGGLEGHQIRVLAPEINTSPDLPNSDVES